MVEITFNEYVDNWDKLCGEIAALNKKLAPLKIQEMEMRKALTASVAAALGNNWKEGVNKMSLSDDRVLKITHKVNRTVDVSELETARKAYALLNDVPCTFDELLRVKYEVDKKSFNKLEGQALLTVSRVITAKDAAPEVELT